MPPGRGPTLRRPRPRKPGERWTHPVPRSGWSRTLPASAGRHLRSLPDRSERACPRRRPSRSPGSAAQSTGSAPRAGPAGQEPSPISASGAARGQAGASDRSGRGIGGYALLTRWKSRQLPSKSHRAHPPPTSHLRPAKFTPMAPFTSRLERHWKTHQWWLRVKLRERLVQQCYRATTPAQSGQFMNSTFLTILSLFPSPRLLL